MNNIQSLGVVWHDCPECGIPWPFPKGHHDDRDWRCAVCCNTVVASIQRQIAQSERLYWMAAVGLVADWLSDVSPEKLDEKRLKCVAVLRNAAYRVGGPDATNGLPIPAESIHDICHNLHGTVDKKAFADACSAEQRRLYGCAPYEDLAKDLANKLRVVDEYF